MWAVFIQYCNGTSIEPHAQGTAWFGHQDAHVESYPRISGCTGRLWQAQKRAAYPGLPPHHGAQRRTLAPTTSGFPDQSTKDFEGKAVASMSIPRLYMSRLLGTVLLLMGSRLRAPLSGVLLHGVRLMTLAWLQERSLLRAKAGRVELAGGVRREPYTWLEPTWTCGALDPPKAPLTPAPRRECSTPSRVPPS